jgi:hypothetical protein
MRTSNDTPLDDAAREDWRAVCTFLAGDPDFFGIVLTMSRLYEPPAVVSFAADSARHLAAQARAEAYIQSGLCQACARCLQPTVLFPDGRMLTWPALKPHESCRDVSDGRAVKPAQREQESATWRRRPASKAATR